MDWKLKTVCNVVGKSLLTTKIKNKKELTRFYFILYSLFLTLSRVRYLGLTIKEGPWKMVTYPKQHNKINGAFPFGQNRKSLPLGDKILCLSFYKLICFL